MTEVVTDRMSSGLQGIPTHLQRLNQTAHNFAKNGAGKGFAENMDKMIIDKHGVAANTVMIKAVDQRLGTLHHVLA